MCDLSRAAKSGLQAAAWLNQAGEVWEAICLDEAVEIDADQYDHLEEGEIECMRHEGLSYWMDEACIEVTNRGEWSAGSEPEVDQVVVLFSTGGPATRVVIDLDRKIAWVEVQDWATPWDDIDEHYGSRLTRDCVSMLLEYADFCVSP